MNKPARRPGRLDFFAIALTPLYTILDFNGGGLSAGSGVQNDVTGLHRLTHRIANLGKCFLQP